MKTSKLSLSSTEESHMILSDIFDKIDRSLESPLRSAPVRSLAFSNPQLGKEKEYAQELFNKKILKHQELERTMTEEIDKLRKERMVPKRLSLKNDKSSSLFQDSFLGQQKTYLGSNQYIKQVLNPVKVKQTGKNFYKQVDINSSTQRAGNMTLKSRGFELEFKVKKD